MFVSVELLIVLILQARNRPSIRHTTLTTAWNWSALALTLLTVCELADSCFHLLSHQAADLIWHITAVFSLAPAIAVLGSRRPGSRNWTAFILVPMLLVLNWPIAAQALQGSEFHGLELESPQVVAYSLVLIMGFGNFCGTRWTLTVLVSGFALLLMIISSSVLCPRWLTDRAMVRSCATAAIGSSIALALISRRSLALNRFDQIWTDFFNAFGIVWARRIQDRLNHLMEQEKLGVRLELDGFRWPEPRHSSNRQAITPDPPNRELVEQRIEYFLRWLLRRFVDPPWIDQRLGHLDPEQPKTNSPVPPLSVDS